MNKFIFVLIFVGGYIFSLILPILRNSMGALTENNVDLVLDQKSGLVPVSDANHHLLDYGYISLRRLREHVGETALASPGITELEEKNDLSEAESCLRAGQRLLEAGRPMKAGRLLERAVALAPSLPRALLALGEYLEQHESDVLRADQLYVRALVLSPRNPRAIRNRIRTKDVVAVHDLRMLQEIELRRLQLSHVPDSTPALKRIQAEAYFHHIHHTVAIEGNTMTLEEIRTILETGLSIGGKSIAEHAEVVGVDSALRFINSSLLHRVGSITLQDLLQIHLRVLGHTDPPAAGHLRTSQVFVGPHLPPAPARLQQLMEQFIDWLNDPATMALHPVRYAALAHYHLVYIHPFVDGNGRTARLLMNFLLMQAGYPPIIIRHQDRLQYYDTLQAANEGDTRPFVRFISHCTGGTLDVYLWATQDAIPGIAQDNQGRGIAHGETGRGLEPSVRLREASHHGGDNARLASQTASEGQCCDQDIGDERCDQDCLDGEQDPHWGQTNGADHTFSPNNEQEFYASKAPPVISDPSESMDGVSEEFSEGRRPVPEHMDDLGVLFPGETTVRAAAHQWLNGLGEREHRRSSRYYSRQYRAAPYTDHRDSVHYLPPHSAGEDTLQGTPDRGL